MNIQFLLPLIILLSLPSTLSSQNYSSGKIANTQYSDFDVPVHTINTVSGFNADNTETKDVSADIQAALDMANTTHGGIVFLSSGTCLIENPLVVPDQVTLGGDWKRPTGQDKTYRNILNTHIDN